MAKKAKQVDLFESVTVPEKPSRLAEAPAKRAEALTVSAFLDYINGLITVQPVLVQGEVTGWRPHPSGVYFSLKDKEDGAMLDCYLNPYLFRGLGVAVEDGMEIKVGGLPSIYKAKGRFSLRVESLELAGEGSLKKAYELLKKQLEKEGLFARKRELPEFIGSVGIITSRTGAVIHDFRNNIAKLGFKLHLKDVRVEGAQAVSQITEAIRLFNDPSGPQVDVLVIMRGGGSLEDLQPFNNEFVARAIFGSRMPTIVAIGHDQDVPIAQMVADVAPSTPTAAAVAINQTWDRLTVDVPAYEQAIVHGFERMLDQARPLLDVRTILHFFDSSLKNLNQKVQSYGTYLETVNPERQLKLGYSIVSDSTGRVIKDSKALKIGESISLRLARGSLKARVEKLQ